MEEWKWIPGWENMYMASSLGRIKSFKRKNAIIMAQLYNPNGYVRVDLCKNRLRFPSLVHRLIAKTFLNNAEGKPEVNHKNGVTDDNRVVNLEWSTKSENGKHSYSVLGRVPPAPMRGKYGKLSKKSKLIAQFYGTTLIKVFHGTNEAFRKTGISQGNIASAARGQRETAGGFIWKYIKKKP